LGGKIIRCKNGVGNVGGLKRNPQGRAEEVLMVKRGKEDIEADEVKKDRNVSSKLDDGWSGSRRLRETATVDPDHEEKKEESKKTQRLNWKRRAQSSKSTKRVAFETGRWSQRGP